MGAAEEAIRRQQDAQTTQADQHIQQLERELAILVPRALANLQRTGYPEIPQVRSELLRIDGTERAAWLLLPAHDSSDHIYLLADGSFIEGRSQPKVVTVKDLQHRSTQILTASLQKIINHKG